jgi:hypothetical protein
VIEFATLFLGLVFGPQRVELLVHEQVETVEILLDHQRVGRLEGTPWQMTVDFGEELAPHVLQAVALDSQGGELDRVEQWVNVFTEQTEVSILVSPRQQVDGFRAQVAWESVAEHLEPQSFLIELDGEPFEVEDPRLFDLPGVDPERTHLLRVELRFSDTLETVAETVFGGPYSGEVTTELTAVPVVLDGRKKLPPLEDMQGWFLEAEKPLTVRAVEDGQAEIVVVRDLATIEVMRKLRPRAVRQQASRRSSVVVLDPPLRKDHSIRFLTPVARSIEREGYRYQLFPPLGPFSRDEASYLQLFSSVAPDGDDIDDQRITDAVAVAGMVAAKSGRRRAVILIAGADSPDRSQLAPAMVIRFLRRLRVPLVVWTPVKGRKEVEVWGPSENVTSRQGLVAAYKTLSKQLDQQRIVWLEGLHLPQRITLSAAAEGLDLVE